MSSLPLFISLVFGELAFEAEAERHKTLRSPVLETVLVHFCRIDQHLPKNVLFDLDLAAQEG